MTKQSGEISELRERIAEQAMKWLNDHFVYGYITQDCEWEDIVPDNFIQARLYRGMNSEEGISKWGKGGSASTRMYIEKAIKNNPRLVILGEAGIGKTTCLHHMALKYATDANGPLPVYINLSDYRSRYGETREAESNVLKRMIRSFLDLRIEEIKDTELILLLDGYSELSRFDKGSLLADINFLKPDLKQSKWIITSRKADYPEGITGWSTCEIIEFDDTQIQQYLNNNLGDSVSATSLWRQMKDENLLDLSRIPLYLSFITELRKLGGPIPRTKGGLINGIVNRKYLTTGNLGKGLSKTSVLHGISPERCKELTSLIAYSIHEKSEGITLNEYAVAQVLEEDCVHQALEILEFLRKIGLVERSLDDAMNSVFSFRHQSFFDYFAGYHIKNVVGTDKSNEDLHNRVLPYLEYYKWDEPFKVLLGFCDQELAERLSFLVLRQRDVFLALGHLSTICSRLSGKARGKFGSKLNEFIEPMLASDLKIPRETIVFEMGRSGSTSLVPCLINIVKNEGSPLRGEAVEALGKIGGPSAMQALIQLTEDEEEKPSLRGGAIRALGSIRDPSPFPDLMHLLECENTDHRKDAIYAMSRMGGNLAEKAHIRLVLDVNCDVRADAADALGVIGDPAALKALIRLSKDDSKLMSEVATEALCHIDDPAAIPTLIRIAKNEDPDVRNSAIIALGRMGDPSAIPALIRMTKDGVIYVRLRAVEALSKINDRRALQALIQLAEEENSDLCESAAELLGEIGGSSAFQVLSHLVESTNPFLLSAAARALGKMAKSSALPTLIKLSKHEHYMVRWRVADALGEIGDPTALQALISMSEDPQDMQRGKVAWALGNLRDPQALRILSQLTEDKAYDVRIDAIKALGKMGSPTALPTLHKLLEDEDCDVRYAATTALGGIADPSVLPVLVRLLGKNEKYRTQQEALWAIGRTICSSPEVDLPEELIRLVSQLREDASTAGKTSHFFKYLQDVSKRRFLYITPSGTTPGETPARSNIVPKDTKADELLADTYGESIEYARVWDMASNPGGDIIDEATFVDIAKKKVDECKIFIIDNGDYKGNAIGTVYFDHKQLYPELKGRTRHRKKEYYLTPLKYRILVYTLKQKGLPGEIYRLIEHCWFMPEAAKRLQHLYEKITEEGIDRDSYDKEIKGYQNSITKVSKLLQIHVGMNLRTGRRKKYQLSSIPQYCYVQLSN